MCVCVYVCILSLCLSSADANKGLGVSLVNVRMLCNASYFCELLLGCGYDLERLMRDRCVLMQTIYVGADSQARRCTVVDGVHVYVREPGMLGFPTRR